MRLDVAYMALTMDIISHYTYGQSHRYLAEDDSKLSWKEAAIAASANSAILRQSPWAFLIMKAVPIPVLRMMDPSAVKQESLQQDVRRDVKIIIQANREGRKTPATNFEALLDSVLSEGSNVSQTGYGDS